MSVFARSYANPTTSKAHRVTYPQAVAMLLRGLLHISADISSCLYAQRSIGYTCSLFDLNALGHQLRLTAEGRPNALICSRIILLGQRLRLIFMEPVFSLKGILLPAPIPYNCAAIVSPITCFGVKSLMTNCKACMACGERCARVLSFVYRCDASSEGQMARDKSLADRVDTTSGLTRDTCGYRGQYKEDISWALTSKHICSRLVRPRV